MGIPDAARIEVAALRGVARQYETVAATLDGAVRTYLNAPAFDGALAGRAHAGGGDAVRAGVEHLGDQLRQWSRAAAEIAAALHTAADRYVRADADASARLG